MCVWYFLYVSLNGAEADFLLVFPQHVILGALPFPSMLEEFRDKVSLPLSTPQYGLPPCTVHLIRSVCQHDLQQGVKAVVTLNEDFELFISSEQYKVCASASCQLQQDRAAPLGLDSRADQLNTA